MVWKTVALRSLMFAVFSVLGAGEIAADVISTPKRLFGLGSINAVAISPDQRFMATAGQAGAFLWDVQTAALIKRLDTPWSVTALTFSPDSKTLVLASVATMVAWQTATGEPLREFRGHQGEITRLHFSPDGQQLISASADNTIRVWSSQTGAEVHALRIPGSPIIDIAISPNGQTLATIDTFLTNCVKIWDIATETQLSSLTKTNWTAQRCLFTPGGHLITSAPDRSVLLWNLETGQEIRSFQGITQPAAIVIDLWLPNENTLAALCNDGAVFLWNLETAALIHTVPGEPLLAGIGVPHDFLTISAESDHNVRIRQLPGGETLRTFKGHTTSVHFEVAISPNGRYVLSGGTERATRLWDRRNGQPIREFLGSPAGTAAAAFSPDGSKVLTTIGLPSPAARLWKTETGELEREFPWAGGWPNGAVFSPDGSKIASRSQGGAIRIFNVANGALIRVISDSSWADALAFSPSAPVLAAASSDFTAKLFNFETGQLLHTFDLNAGPVSALAFSPNGDTLMIAWQDGFIHLYNPVTMELLRDFVSPAAFLETACYSPDGRFILTGEGWPFFTATLWDAQTTRPLRTFQNHKWGVSAAAFSPDGASILTGAEIVREWSIADLAASLAIEKVPGHMRLTWSLGQLEHASKITGPWQALTEATSPLLVPLAQPIQLYRVRIDEDE